MGNEIKRKFLWLDVWDIEEQEAWFSDMSSRGWKLIGIDKWMATFEKCEPQKVNYRCDIFQLNEEHENRVEFYEQSGWGHVTSRGFLQIFREIKGKSSIEIHTDPIEQVETLAILKKDIKIRGLLILLLSMMMLILTVWTLQIDPVSNYLNDGFIETVVLLIVYLFISISVIRGMIHMSTLMKKLKSGSLLNHNLNFRKKMRRNKLVGSCVIFFVSLWVISVYVNLTLTLKEERFPAIPNKELPIIQLSDIMDDSDYRQVKEVGGQGDPLNYYSVKSSFLVPKQYELQQNVEVPGVIWEDNSGTYSPSIRSYGYEVRSEWLARKFVQDLKEQHTYYTEEYEAVISHDFDELWMHEEEEEVSFIARKDHVIHYVVYYGKEPSEYIVEQTLVKIK